MNKKEELLATLKQIVDEHKDTSGGAVAQFSLAEHYLKRGDIETAGEYLDDFINNPCKGEVVDEIVADVINKWREAGEKSLTKNVNNYGYLLERLEFYNEAKAAYKAAAELESRIAEFNLNILLIKRGEYSDKVIDDVLLALLEDNYLGKNPFESVKELLIISIQKSSNPDLLNKLGVLFKKFNNIETAKDYFLQAYNIGVRQEENKEEINESSKEAAYNLFATLEKNDEYAHEAVLYLDAAARWGYQPAVERQKMIKEKIAKNKSQEENDDSCSSQKWKKDDRDEDDDSEPKDDSTPPPPPPGGSGSKLQQSKSSSSSNNASDNDKPISGTKSSGKSKDQAQADVEQNNMSEGLSFSTFLFEIMSKDKNFTDVNIRLNDKQDQQNFVYPGSFLPLEKTEQQPIFISTSGGNVVMENNEIEN